MSREKTLAKNTFILAIGNVLPKAVSFITLPILTACLSKAEYGTYDLINTLVSLFLPIITLQIHSAAFRFLVDKRNELISQKKIITNIYIFTLGVSALSLIVLYFVLYKYSILTRVLICFYFFFDILVTTGRQIVRGLGKNKVYSISSIFNSLTNLIFVFLFVKLMLLGLDGVLASLVFALIVSHSYMIYKINLFKYFDINLVDIKLLKELLKYSWPMIPNSLSGWVMRLSDRLVITTFLGIEANAVYGVANKLPVLYGILQNTFTIAWQENASIVSKDSDTEEYYSNMFDIMYSLFFAIMAMLIAMTPFLFLLFIRGDYEEAYYQMPILYIGVFFNSLSAYLGGIYVAKMETKKVGVSTFFAALCNLGIDLLLVNKIGIYAGSISTLISYVVLVLYRMWDVQKIQRIRFNFSKNTLLLLCLIVMGILSYQRNKYYDIINIIMAITLAILTNKKIFFSTLLLIKQKIYGKIR